MAEHEEYVVVPELIYEVERRPAIWDRTLADYKNKTVVHNSWVDLCTVLRNDFGELEEDEKEEMIKFAIKKWVNIRDIWTKYYKKEILNPKVRKTKLKRYIHHDACMFLKKVHGLGRSDGSESTGEDTAVNGSRVKSNAAKRKVEKSTIAKVEDKPIKTEPKKNTVPNNEVYRRCEHHISFFKGILPAIAHLNENDTLQFQIGVLNVIKDLRTTQEAPDPSLTEVYVTPHEEVVPVERVKREASVDSKGSSFNGEEEYLSDEFLEY